VGMWIGPPNALDWPNPMSSISTISTFGAPAGALTWKRGGGGGALRMSSTLLGSTGGLGIGKGGRATAGRGGRGAWRPAPRAAVQRGRQRRRRARTRMRPEPRRWTWFFPCSLPGLTAQEPREHAESGYRRYWTFGVKARSKRG